MALPLIVVLVVVAIYFARRPRAKGRSTTTGPVESPAGPSLPPFGSRRAESGSCAGTDLERDLARWVAAGLLSERQSAAIVAHEEAMARGSGPCIGPALGAGSTCARRRGGARLPRRHPRDGRARSRGGAVLAGHGARGPARAQRRRRDGILVAGALVHEPSDPALARLRGFLWLLDDRRDRTVSRASWSPMASKQPAPRRSSSRAVGQSRSRVGSCGGGANDYSNSSCAWAVSSYSPARPSWKWARPALSG